MTRPIGREVFQHWGKGPEVFGEAREDVQLERLTGCWPEFKSTDEGVGEHRNVAEVIVGVWIPQDFKVDSAGGDYFVWERYPDERYYIEGKVGRYITRRGQLKACYVPVEAR